MDLLIKVGVVSTLTLLIVPPKRGINNAKYRHSLRDPTGLLSLTSSMVGTSQHNSVLITGTDWLAQVLCSYVGRNKKEDVGKDIICL